MRRHQRVRPGGALCFDKVAQDGGQPSWAEHRIHAHQSGQICRRLRRGPADQKSRTLALESVLARVTLRPTLRHE